MHQWLLLFLFCSSFLFLLIKLRNWQIIFINIHFDHDEEFLSFGWSLIPFSLILFLFGEFRQYFIVLVFLFYSKIQFLTFRNCNVIKGPWRPDVASFRLKKFQEASCWVFRQISTIQISFCFKSSTVWCISLFLNKFCFFFFFSFFFFFRCLISFSMADLSLSFSLTQVSIPFLPVWASLAERIVVITVKWICIPRAWSLVKDLVWWCLASSFVRCLHDVVVVFLFFFFAHSVAKRVTSE